MSNRISLLLFGLVSTYLLFFYHLGSVAFLGADEPRYARIGEEMWRRSEWVTPTLNFAPWLEKPPLLFWLESLSFQVLGVSEGAARLPVALLALAAVSAVAVWGYERGGWRLAALSGWILATTPLFWIFGRFASTDMPLTAFLTVAFLFGFLATRRGSAWLGAGLGVSLGLAALAKGPVSLLLFGMVFAIYFWMRGRILWGRLQMLAALLGLAASALPWYWLVWQENGYDFVATFWLNHHLARFLTDIHHHSQPVWYYLPVLLAGFFPWTFFLGSSGLTAYRKRRELLEAEDEDRLLLWLWVLVPLLFFSLSRSKLPGYILPVFPALALLVAQEWERYLEGDFSLYRVMKVQTAVYSAFCLVLIGVLVFGFHFVYGSLSTGILLAVPLGLMLAVTQHASRHRRPSQLFLSLVGGMTLFAAVLFWQAAPVIEDYHSARDLSRLALPRISREAPLVLYRYFHHTAQYYTDYQTTNEALSGPDELRRYMARNPRENYWLLTQRAGWEDLRLSFGAELIQREGNLYLVKLPRG